MGCHPLGRAGAAAVCACAAPAASRISASHPRTIPLVVRPTSPPPETWSGWDSNPRPPGCKPGALPTELPPHVRTVRYRVACSRTERARLSLCLSCASTARFPNVRRLGLMCVMVAACQPAASPLRLGTTYTVQQSGALAVLESLWTGPRFTTVVAPSGQILRAAANGDLDVVITHAPALEQRLLVAPGLAVLRCPLVASRFAIVGPAADPARVAAVPSAAAAFRRIAAVGGPFVSRGDSSGTHVKELALW